MKVLLDQEKCIGSGQCVLVAGNVFDQRDEDGIAVLLQEYPDAADQDDVREAAQICPALAIAVSEQ